MKLRLNNAKSRKHLNWNQKISFENTIKFTVEWYLNQNSKKIYSITKDQIELILRQ